MDRLALVALICALIVAVVGVVVSLTRTRDPVSSPVAIAPEEAPAPLPPSPISSPRSSVLPSPSRPFVPAPADRASVAMNETVVKSLVANLKTAIVRGDVPTADVLAKGLRPHRPAAEIVLREEIARSTDPAVRQRLEEIANALSGETK